MLLISFINSIFVLSPFPYRVWYRDQIRTVQFDALQSDATSRAESKSHFVAPADDHSWWIVFTCVLQMWVVSSHLLALHQWTPQWPTSGMPSFLENLCLLFSGANGKWNYFSYSRSVRKQSAMNASIFHMTWRDTFRTALYLHPRRTTESQLKLLYPGRGPRLVI